MKQAKLRCYQAWIVSGLPLALALSLPINAKAAVLASSNFNHSSEGWKIAEYNAGNWIFVNPMHIPRIFGNGGYLIEPDRKFGTWFWDAPAQFLGNMSAAYGGILAFDLKQWQTSFQRKETSDLLLMGGGYKLSLDTAYHPGTNWTPYNILLHESFGWKNLATGLTATRNEMLAVLSSLTALRINGDYGKGLDISSIDNVVLNARPKIIPKPTPRPTLTPTPTPTPKPISVPEPSSTLGLFAFGIFSAISLLKRKQKALDSVATD
jgi:Laminin B (Domain IV)/PEP-CTERM motif